VIGRARLHTLLRAVPLGALRHPVFAIYTGGHFVSQLGTWIQQVATGWLVWLLTGSETWLGLVAFCQFAPGIFLAPLAGAWADRLDRLLIVRVAQLAASFLAALLWLLVALEAITPVVLLLIVLASGAVGAVSLPSMRAVVTRLVPRSAIGSAVSINAITLNIARFVGPAVAGVLIHLDQLALCFLLNALSYGAFVLGLELVARNESRRPDRVIVPVSRGSTFSSILEGLRYAMRHPLMPMILCLYFIYALLARPVVDLMPAIVVQLLGRGAETLALLNSVFGVVAIGAGLLLSGVTRPARHERLYTASMIGLAIGTALLVSAPGLTVAVAAMLIFGAAQVTVNVTSQTLMQLSADETVRGRVLALHFMMFRTGAALGGLIVGFLAEYIGLRSVFVLAAGVLALSGVLAMRGGLRNKEPASLDLESSSGRAPGREEPGPEASKEK
jgi:MFS family permease